MVFEDISLIEDYQLEYALYTAEKAMLDETSVIELKYSKIVNESVVYLNEASINIKETLMKYVRMIIPRIQKVWDNFKNGIDEAVWNKIKDQYSQYFKSDRKLKISDVNDKDTLPAFNEITKFISITNGNASADFLIKYYKNGTENSNGDTQFSEKDNDGIDTLTMLKDGWNYFSGCKEFSKEEMSAVVNNACFEPIKKEGITITSADLQQYIQFLDKYKDTVSVIQKDLRDINGMERTIDSLTQSFNGTVQSAQNNTQSNDNTSETNTTNTEESSIDIGQNIIYEYKTDDADNPGGKGGNEEAKAAKGLQKSVTSYFKIYTQVLSLKLSTLSKARTKSLKLVLEYGRNAAKQAKANQQTKVETDSKGATQVKA